MRIWTELTVIFLVGLAFFFVTPTQTDALNFSVFSFSIPTPPPAPTIPNVSVPSSTPKANVVVSIKPSSQPSAKPTSTPKPTKKPRGTATSVPTPSATTSADTIQNFIMNAINNYRKTQGLSSVSTNSDTCNFAKVRAYEISLSFNHDGFSNRISSKTLPYPSYHTVTENISMTSDYKNVVNNWINSFGHAANMRADTPFVCVEKYGNYYAYEGWKP